MLIRSFPFTEVDGNDVEVIGSTGPEVASEGSGLRRLYLRNLYVYALFWSQREKFWEKVY